MELSEILASTSFIPAFLSFSVAFSYWRFYQRPQDDRIVKIAAFVFWGICYVMVQLRVNWFVVNQILYFRNANVLVMFAMLYPALKIIFVTMYNDVRANAKRNFNSNQ